MDESSFGSPSPKVESSLFSSRCIKGWGGSGLWLVRHREQIDYTMSDLIKAAWRNYLLQLQLHPLRTKVSSHSHFLPFKRSFYFRTFFPIMFGCWEKWGDRKGKFELLGMMAVVVLDSLNSWIGWGWVDFEVPFVSSATKQSFALYMYFFFLWNMSKLNRSLFCESSWDWCCFQAITAGVLVGCSDVIAQKISGIKRLQLRRLILMMVCRFRSIFPLRIRWSFWSFDMLNFQYDLCLMVELIRSYMGLRILGHLGTSSTNWWILFLGERRTIQQLPKRWIPFIWIWKP